MPEAQQHDAHDPLSDRAETADCSDQTNEVVNTEEGAQPAVPCLDDGAPQLQEESDPEIAEALEGIPPELFVPYRRFADTLPHWQKIALVPQSPHKDSTNLGPALFAQAGGLGVWHRLCCGDDSLRLHAERFVLGDQKYQLYAGVKRLEIEIAQLLDRKGGLRKNLDIVERLETLRDRQLQRLQSVMTTDHHLRQRPGLSIRNVNVNSSGAPQQINLPAPETE